MILLVEFMHLLIVKVGHTYPSDTRLEKVFRLMFGWPMSFLQVLE